MSISLISCIDMDTFLDKVHQELNSTKEKVIVTGNDSAGMYSIIYNIYTSSLNFLL